MKRILLLSLLIVSFLFFPTVADSQKKVKSADQITASDLKTHVTFLASPYLKGRMNGEDGLEIAAEYIASQAKLIGLKPANNGSYFQPYSVISKTMDAEKTSIQIISKDKEPVVLKEPFIQLIPFGPTDMTLEGEIVFAGYGIKADKYKYNDFETIKPEGKILLIMHRAPTAEDGKTGLFEESSWYSDRGLQAKITTMMMQKPKAILIVPDPKSGFKTFEETKSEIAGIPKSRVTLKGEKEIINPMMAALPKVIFIPASVADAILNGTGKTLAELQKSIDSSMKPSSFLIENKTFKLNEVSLTEEKTLRNVAGYIEGSDPVLKNELIIFSGHYDHIGGSGDKINTGADDDASGCAALISMAKAFSSLDKKPKRSVLFLWVSGEEIGLFGSQSYVNSPLFPLNQTVADLNMDMIGRVKGVADTTSETPMTGPKGIFVITDNQSKELQAIADEIDKRSPLDLDYSLSGKNHPLQLFSRSDHYNFVKKDIPVLFFSSGIHTDYHTTGDVVEKLDFEKMELVTRTMYEIGLNVADRKTRINVDNPFSSWTKSK